MSFSSIMKPTEISSGRSLRPAPHLEVPASLVFILSLTLLSCSERTETLPDTEVVREKSESVDPESLWTPARGEEGEAETVGTPVTAGGAYAQVWASCHGARGEGNEEIKSASIDGLP